MEKKLLTFPTEFIIKIIGNANESFEGLVIGILRKHVPDLGEGAVTIQYSQHGKYISLSVKINATSQEQLDSLYRELSSDPEILVVL